MKCRTIATALVVTAFQGIEAELPNILWLTSEDNNVNWVGCYGNPHAETPNIDRLAKEGFQYMHCYANAPRSVPPPAVLGSRGFTRSRWGRRLCASVVIEQDFIRPLPQKIT